MAPKKNVLNPFFVIVRRRCENNKISFIYVRTEVKFFVLTAVLYSGVPEWDRSCSRSVSTVGGWGPTQYPALTIPPVDAPWGPTGYPGHTLELVTSTGSLDLTPGTYIRPINPLVWTIDYTYGGTATDPNAWSDVSFNFTALRNIIFDGKLLVL